MKKFNSKGFTTLELLLIIVLVGGLIGAGVYVYQKNNATEDQDDTSLNSEQEENTSEEVVEEPARSEGWVSFTPNSGAYTVKLPDGWTFMHQDDDCDCLFAESMTYSEGEPAQIQKVQGGRDGIGGFFIVVDDSDLNDQRFSGRDSTGGIETNAGTATTYYDEQTTEPEGIGPEKGSETYEYYLEKEGQYVYASYTIAPGAEDNRDLVEEVIQSIR